jgi:hypothetical protein
VIPGVIPESVSASPCPGEGGGTGTASPCRHDVGFACLSPQRETEISVAIEISSRGIDPEIRPCLGAPSDPAGGDQEAPKWARAGKVAPKGGLRLPMYVHAHPRES